MDCICTAVILGYMSSSFRCNLIQQDDTEQNKRSDGRRTIELSQDKCRYVLSYLHGKLCIT